LAVALRLTDTEGKKELVDRAIQGDYQAFGELYEIYLDPIFRYVLYQVKDAMVAEDITEETFLKAWKGRGSYRGGSQSMSAWLYRIAHNQVVDEFRRRAHYRSADLAAETGAAPSVLDDPLEKAEGALRQDELLRAIATLPPRQKQVIILKFIEGLGNDEIAQITGKSQGAIRIMQMRALSELRQQFEVERR
jgi:RNA polymerase sigma-70 factor, ECF subfamily